MKIVVAGGTGLVGRALAQSLARDGHEVILLTRQAGMTHELPSGVRLLAWDSATADGWLAAADGADAMVNLAGENLAAGRWNERRKRAVLESRLGAGAAAVDFVRQAAQRPTVLIQASAVGYYGPSDELLLDEDTPPGDDFLARVCQAWEASTRPVEALGVRRVVVRLGVVWSAAAGALPRMVLPFRWFVGGPLGSGRQWLSWVHIADQVRALRFLIETPAAHGAYNVSATPLRNQEFAQALGKVLRRPARFPVPASVIRLLFGEMGTVVLDGQHVSARRLTDLGFQFRFPQAEMALRDLLIDRKEESRHDS
ncbi:MAG: TIGR01777 family oxidoreductase [Chloroflexota bacterium]